ncbi:geranylgeranylglyceryl/heptaprenylglyceryl phosphate synthase [Tunicatimonas pelagia]|uniref:geranylgeranylglyceryl/heptaprenylglyceryl phosphate synthase n=1 Tax=Tunicatimonas pelagia TaxID=931531 RepID=UPI00266568E9|nr:geranylgeranylglyceryl/heptaprenylglyceryl phosphate synthase [Tunicatimonas pelagia]WKN40923.1 geranylgeranylglyceryl/heptaprenylglyceryl phosphate synthase [Tunicatimonas pelagia]
MSGLYQALLHQQQQKKKSLAIFIDPDQLNEVADTLRLISLGAKHQIDYFLVGGSLITTNNLGEAVRTIKDECDIPVILFPGSNLYIDSSADAILLLSIISGRNPDLLIGQHVVAAPILKRSPLEIMATGYILVNTGSTASATYLSHTTPIPHDKASVAACTAMAGEMLGLKLIYLDAGTEAERAIDPKMISAVRKSVGVPLIVGGGINNRYQASRAYEAGADMLVVGGVERTAETVLPEIAEVVQQLNKGKSK